MKWPWNRDRKRPVEDYQKQLDKIIAERATSIATATEDLQRLVKDRQQRRPSGGAREA